MIINITFMIAILYCHFAHCFFYLPWSELTRKRRMY